MTTEQLLYTIICIVFFLLAFIALVNPNKVNVSANRWLGLFFVFVALKVASSLVFSFKIEHRYTILTGFVDLTTGFMPVLFYLSIVQFATPGSINKRYYASFIPGIVIFLIVLPFHISGFKGYPVPHWIDLMLAITVMLVSNLQIWLFWLLANRKLNQHQRNIRLVASNVAPVDLGWLRYTLNFIGVMMLIYVGNNLLKMRTHGLYEPIIYLGCGFVICYHLIAQKEIYPYQPGQIIEVSEVIEEFQHQPMVAKSRFDDETASRLKLRLDQLMTNQRLYLDTELNLPQLAEHMQLSVHDLSYLLNEVVGSNFFQYINEHRVEEAKQLMLSGKYKHLNILGIAYSAGFSSKTTFNTAFKKQTGLSPSQFLKQAQQSPQSSVALN